jgi:alpha-tubulin suppressor-like RCC1 family protein
VVPLLGTVNVPNLQSWTIEFAAGYRPSSDFEYIPLRIAGSSELVLGVALVADGWDTTRLTDGQFTLRLRAYRRDLGSVFFYRTVQVDNTTPEAPTLVMTPPSGYGTHCKNGDALTFSGSAEAGTAVAGAWLVGDNRERLAEVTGQLTVHAASGLISGSAVLPITPAASVRLEVRIRDAAGNVSSPQSSDPLTVDNAPPAARFVDPDGRVSVNRMPVTCVVEATDGGSGVKRVEVRVNQGTWQPATSLGGSQWSYTFNTGTSGLLYDLETRAIDAVDNVQSVPGAIEVVYFANLPSAWVHFPTNDYDLGWSTNLAVRVTATDADADPADFAWYLEQRQETNGVWQLLGAGRQPLTNQVALDWPHGWQFAPGDYTLRLTSSNRFTVARCERRLHFGGPPAITRDPTDVAARYGNQVSLQVEAGGMQPLLYQWSLNQTNLAGATNGSYFIANFQSNHVGVYQVTVSNPIGIARSAEAMVYPSAGTRVVGWGDGGAWASPPDSLNIVELSAGWDFVLGLRANGTVHGWGNNASGKATPPTGLDQVVQVGAGASYAMALRADGVVVGWGLNQYGNLNLPAGLTKVVQIAVGSNHAIALRSDGTVIGWGYNEEGQASPPADLREVAMVSAGYANSMALKSNGTVVVWGRASQGSLNVPAGLTNAVQISSGADHCVALASDGRVYCWGKTAQGQCNVPAGLTNVQRIAAGGFHSLALRSDGTVACWGGAGFGRVRVPAGLSNVVRIAGGGENSQALVALPSSLSDFSPTILLWF